MSRLPVSWSSRAKTDFYLQVAYYEEQSTTLGRRFAREVYKTTRQIREFPGIGRLFDAERGDEIRAFRVNGFPFLVAYQESTVEIQVLALVHERRRPPTL